MINDNENGRLARIETKLDSVISRVEEILPICEIVTRHDERLKVLENWHKAIWSVVFVAVAALIGIGIKVVYGR